MIDRDLFWRLLPAYHRRRDEETGGPLRQLLEVFAEQAAVLEADIAQQYDNWFLETCEEWVVPYIGDAIGYTPVHAATARGGDTAHAELLQAILAPRREVANTIRYRRRKGTLGLLEQIAADVTGWPALAMEVRHRVAATVHLRCPQSAGPGTASLRARGLDALGGPADRVARVAELRRSAAVISPGRHGLAAVELFVARHAAVPVTRAEAVCVTRLGPHCFQLNATGVDAPLYRPSDLAARVLPSPLTRAALPARDDRSEADPALYGENRALMLWTLVAGESALQPVAAARIVPTDLRRWDRPPPRGKVALDPERGRAMFAPNEAPLRLVASCYEGRLGDIGASERPRHLDPVGARRHYSVGSGETGERHGSLHAALHAWRREKPADALIELTDSGSFDEQELAIALAAGQRLEIRAAGRTRPLIRLSDYDAARFDAWRISGHADSSLVLDGLVLSGHGLQVAGPLGTLLLRRCTLVPAALTQSVQEALPSLRVEHEVGRIRIERSLVGPIQAHGEARSHEPSLLEIADSVVDGGVKDAMFDAATGPAYVALDIRRSTILGRSAVHRIVLAENCIFTRRLTAVRRQSGVVRFCYLLEGSHTPMPSNCVPGRRTGEEPLQGPVFVSLRQGEPGYCQLASQNAPDILRGSSDQAELGVFHDLYTPQLQANLSARLAEYVPASADVGVVYLT